MSGIALGNHHSYMGKKCFIINILHISRIYFDVLTNTVQILEKRCFSGQGGGIFQCVLFINNKVELTSISVSINLRIKRVKNMLQS